MSSTQAMRRLAFTLLIPGAACAHLHHASPAAGPVVLQGSPAAPSSAVAASPHRADATRKRRLPTDANVAGILLAAGNTDLSYARLAVTRAQSPAVKAFADRMLRDNDNINHLVLDLSAAIDLFPTECQTSLDYRDQSAALRDVLRDLHGHDFDITYITNEVAHHKQLLASIDSVLVPVSRNAKLKQFVSNLRPAIAAQLAQAEEIRDGLGRTGAGR
jgi:putative membrane protein